MKLKTLHTLAVVSLSSWQKTWVMSAFFGAGEHQVNVAITIRDEALHAVQVPALVFLTGAITEC